jgi:hypothetical protein
MAQKNDLVWATWSSVLQQMDNGGRPSPGCCANACRNAKLPSHIYCEPCRVARGGYKFVKTV